ncbi:MAG TPA: hypothetical protein VFT22_30985 [Kofleriaceae bacterium]|nr:hypothetical protein [Kofleriaceae bacterium]
MTRFGALLATVVPSLIAGGLLFGSVAGHAETGRDDALGFWPAASDAATGVRLAQADPWAHTRPRVPPVPPMPGAIPAPPVPAPPVPAPPPGMRGHHHNRGVSVSFHDGKIEIDGLEEVIANQLERVDEVLDNLQDVPPEVRERVKDRVRGVREKLRTRLRSLRSMDLDKIGPEMERMGDDIEKEMEGLDKDLSQFGDRLGKHFAQKFGKEFANRVRVNGSHDRDNSDDGDDSSDDEDDRDSVGVDDDLVDPSDMRSAIAELKNLTLDQTQKVKLAELRAESERKINEAKRQLEDMTTRLHDTLGDASASETDIATQIDRISATEATIRKARILAWVRVRSLLDKDQRKKVEAAVRHH